MMFCPEFPQEENVNNTLPTKAIPLKALNSLFIMINFIQGSTNPDVDIKKKRGTETYSS